MGNPGSATDISTILKANFLDLRRTHLSVDKWSLWFQHYITNVLQGGELLDINNTTKVTR